MYLHVSSSMMIGSSSSISFDITADIVPTSLTLLFCHSARKEDAEVKCQSSDRGALKPGDTGVETSSEADLPPPPIMAN